MDNVADLIRERAIRLFAKAAAAREQGHIEHALKLTNLAAHVMNEASAAETSAAAEARSHLSWPLAWRRHRRARAREGNSATR
jgi:hypothetical protein